MNTVDSVSITIYVVTSIPILLVLYHWHASPSLRHIPTVGSPPGPLLSYIGAFNWMFHSHKIIQEGYDKYKGGLFKVAVLARWLVIVTGAKVDELHRFSDEYVSFSESQEELWGSQYWIGHTANETLAHSSILRTQLTRQLATLFPEIIDEITAAFEDIIHTLSDGWLKVDALSIISNVVGRVNNRVFLGLPICRDEEFLMFVSNFSHEVSRKMYLMTQLPPMVKLPVVKMMSRLDEHADTCLKYVGDKIGDRLEMMNAHGIEWSNKPNDMLQWLIDEEMERRDFDPKNIARTLLALNFVSIHTSSLSFVHALYHLAADPKILGLLREEVEVVTNVDGWTKAAMGNMRKLDSFMRESQRMNIPSSTAIMRKVIRDIRFSDGTFVPAGTILAAASTPAHMDEENYANAQVFNPWRFSNMPEDEEGTKYQLVSTSADYLSFGVGKHACPGRFFAANELKAMMAYVVVNYDVKFEEEGVRPPNKYFGSFVLPDTSARVLFRRRHT